MPFRTVNQQSDRGKIKDLAHSIEVTHNHGSPPTAFELRMKKLFEFAELCNDAALKDALGFITTDYIADKNAMPLIAYRLRKIVSDIKSKSPADFERLSQGFGGYMKQDEISKEAIAHIKPLVKLASLKRTPVFRRVSE